MIDEIKFDRNGYNSELDVYKSYYYAWMAIQDRGGKYQTKTITTGQIVILVEYVYKIIKVESLATIENVYKITEKWRKLCMI